MLDLILSVAKNDERIRAVILNGSRVNDKIPKDDLQDFDVVFLVKELDSFARESNWMDVFGDRIILQTPNSMNVYDSDVTSNQEELVYLMLFKDHNRIDLTLVKVEDRSKKKDSLTQVLLDKDNLYVEHQDPNDSDYWIKKPTQKEFSDTCNEFWWVSTYVVKALLRNEIMYAKDLQETIVRKMLMSVIAWNIASDYGFEVNLGANNRYLHKYLDSHTLHQIETTYSNYSKVETWNGLMSMIDIFHQQSMELASQLGITYNLTEANNVQSYIQEMHNDQKTLL